MRAKRHLQTCMEQTWTMEEIRAMAQKNMKNVNFVHKDIQKIISWRKTLKKCNEQ